MTAPLPIEYSEIQPPWETPPPPYSHYTESIMLQGEEVKHYFQEEGRVWFHCEQKLKIKERDRGNHILINPGIPHHLQA